MLDNCPRDATRPLKLKLRERASAKRAADAKAEKLKQRRARDLQLVKYEEFTDEIANAINELLPVGEREETYGFRQDWDEEYEDAHYG